MAAPDSLTSSLTTSQTAPSAGRIHVLQILGNAIAGGMESCAARLIERLPRERFTVTVLCPFESPFTERLRQLDVEVLITPMPLDNPPWCSIQLIHALVRSAAIDVLHAHLPNAHLLAGLAGCIAGKPVLTTIHSRLLTPLDLEVHRATGTHFNVVCKHTYFHALGLGVNASQLSCIPNGVDTQVFAPRPANRGGQGGLRQRLGIPAEAPVAGFVGRLHWEKGPDVFVHAAALLAHRLPDAHFVLVGDGPMHDQLAESIRHFSLADRVHLAGVSNDMPAVYNEFDIAVSSSYSEAMPLAVMEAMASALPVIATDVGGVPDLIEQECTGRLVAPGDFKAIADALAQFLAAPETLRQMGRQARQRAIGHLALDTSVERTAQVLTRLVANHGEPRRVGAGVGAVFRDSGKA